MSSPRALHGDARAKRRLVYLYAAAFFVVGIWVPYAQLWLEGLGLSAVQIGIVLALRSWTGGIANPIAGSLADRWHAPHRVIRIMAALATIGYVALVFANSFWSVAVIVTLIGLTFSPVGSLTDGIAVNAARSGRLDYGRTRSWGSLSFIAASLVGGPVIAAFGNTSIVVGLAAAAIITAVCALALPAAPSPDAVSNLPKRRSFDLETPGFWWLVATSAALQTSHTMLYGFASLTWRDLGFDEHHIGLLWSEGVVAEIVLFFVAGRMLPRLRPTTYLMFAAAGGMLRWSGLAIATSGWATAGLQLLHAATFAAAHLGIMAFITTRVPATKTTTATGLHAAVTHSLAMGLAMPVAGLLYEQYGQAAYFAMATMSTIALILAVRVRRIVDRTS